MPQYINAYIINRAGIASVGIDAGGRPPIHKSRSIHPVDDPSGFLYKGFVRVKFVVPYFFCTYLRQSRVTAARMMIPSNMN